MEQKELLLKDLCARLPYGLKLKIRQWKTPVELTIIKRSVLSGNYIINENYKLDDIKPYLRPLSSMTEEEQKEFVKFHCVNICPIVITEKLTISNESEMFDWLDRKMFDYRGLIPLGSALEAPEGMYNN